MLCDFETANYIILRRVHPVRKTDTQDASSDGAAAIILAAEGTAERITDKPVWVDGVGWAPVDSSEASKHPDKLDYYYGNLDENRIYFSRGRDITLSPPQEAGPVNYLIYPYVEVDGEVHDGVEKTFAFRDLAMVVSARH